MQFIRPSSGIWSFAIIWMGMLCCVAAVELPAETLEALKAEKFSDRRKAEMDLLAWTRQRPDDSLDALYQQTRTAPEAEVRERCLAVLRELVNDEFLRNGVGYLGAQLDNQLRETRVADEAQARIGISMNSVQPNTPAEKAGLLAGDVLVGIDDAVWTLQDSSTAVIGKIKSHKPGTRVMARIVRDGKLLELPVVLGRRPASADAMTMRFNNGQLELPSPEELAAADQAEKDAYFHRWLELRKARP